MLRVIPRAPDLSARKFSLLPLAVRIRPLACKQGTSLPLSRSAARRRGSTAPFRPQRAPPPSARGRPPPGFDRTSPATARPSPFRARPPVAGARPPAFGHGTPPPASARGRPPALTHPSLACARTRADNGCQHKLRRPRLRAEQAACPRSAASSPAPLQPDGNLHAHPARRGRPHHLFLIFSFASLA